MMSSVATAWQRDESKMRRILFEVLSVALIIASLFFFYWGLQFLAKPDYVAGVLASVIGIVVIRAATQLVRAMQLERGGSD